MQSSPTGMYSLTGHFGNSARRSAPLAAWLCARRSIILGRGWCHVGSGFAPHTQELGPGVWVSESDLPSLRSRIWVRVIKGDGLGPRVTSQDCWPSTWGWLLRMKPVRRRWLSSSSYLESHTSLFLAWDLQSLPERTKDKRIPSQYKSAIELFVMECS